MFMTGVLCTVCGAQVYLNYTYINIWHGSIFRSNIKEFIEQTEKMFIL